MTNEQFVQAMRDAGLPDAAAPAPEAEAPAPQFVVRRYVKRGTDEAVPHVRSVYLGRNDPCPCECGRKAKKCERGVELLEKARWA